MSVFVLPLFNPLHFANRLKEVGVPEKQAEAEAEVLHDAFSAQARAMSALEDQVKTLVTADARHDAEQNAAKSDTDVVKKDIVAIKSDIVEMKKDIVAIKSDIVEMKKDIVAIKSDIVEMKKDIVALKSDVAAVKSDIALVRKDMEAMEDRLVIRLTKVMLTVAGMMVAVMGCAAGIARLLW